MKKPWRIFGRTLITIINAVILVFFLFVIGIARPDLSERQREKSCLIGVSYMTMNNDFYKIMHEQISDRIEAEGDRMILRNPALSAERQIEEIDHMLDEGIDALVLTPVDMDSVSEILHKAKSRGVKIVVADTNVADPELADCSVVSDNYHAGELIGAYYLTKHEKSDVVVVTHESAVSGRDRVRGFLDTIAQNPQIRVVAKLDGEGQMEQVVPLMQELIAEGTQFDSVFCLNDPSAIGAAAALESAGRLDEVDVYGVDGSPDAKALIADGKMEASVAQYPSRIGAMTADALYSLLQGKTTEAEVRVPVDLVTQENVQEFQVDRWL